MQYICIVYIIDSLLYFLLNEENSIVLIRKVMNKTAIDYKYRLNV